MEVGPFRTVPASQTASGKVELKLVEGGWDEFATVVFGEYHIWRCQEGHHRPGMAYAAADDQSINHQGQDFRLFPQTGTCTSWIK
jgi:hypothetical protein